MPVRFAVVFSYCRRVGVDGTMVRARGEAGYVLQPEGRQASTRDPGAQRGEQAEKDRHQGARLPCRIRQTGKLGGGEGDNLVDGRRYALSLLSRGVVVFDDGKAPTGGFPEYFRGGKFDGRRLTDRRTAVFSRGRVEYVPGAWLLGLSCASIISKIHPGSLCEPQLQALTVNALSGDDRELWMRAIADKVQQLKDALVVLPKRKGTR